MPNTDASTSLIIGHDGSSGADRALGVGLDLADRLDARAEILRSFLIDEYPATVTELLGYPAADAELSASLREQLIAETRSAVAAHPYLVTDAVVGVGRPADVLCAAAEGARMLVVGSRGRGGFVGLLLGSVSKECLHRSVVPVLVVPDSGRHAVAPAPADTGDPAPAIAAGSIVVGNDGSDHSAVALETALGLGRDLGAPVVVIRCWTIDTAPTGSIWDQGYVNSVAEISLTVTAELEDDIRPLLEKYPTTEVATRGIFGGAEELLVRSSVGALMLVVGTRGRGGFQGLLLGSVSTQCVDRAECPVLVVPSQSRSTNGGLRRSAE